MDIESKSLTTCDVSPDGSTILLGFIDMDGKEAIEKANSLPFGLAAYAFTRSAHNADRLANDVEAGNLAINHFVASVAETPFGGVKDSGYGRESGTEGLYCYTVAKNVSHKMMSP